MTHPHNNAHLGANALHPPAEATAAALSDPVRLRLLFALHAAPGATTGLLADAANITPNNATKALQHLATTGLITRTTNGRHAHWHLTDTTAHQLLHHLGAPHTDQHPPH